MRRYDFNGGALTDLSRQERDISSGSVLSTTGVDGDASGAVEMDGYTILQAPEEGLPMGDAPRTICTWAQISDWSEAILSYGDGLSLRLDNGTVTFGTEQSYMLSDFVMPYRTWLHLCGRFDGSVMSVFINGRFHGSTPASLGTLLAEPLTLGGDGAALSFMKGKSMAFVSTVLLFPTDRFAIYPPRSRPGLLPATALITSMQWMMNGGIVREWIRI